MWDEPSQAKQRGKLGRKHEQDEAHGEERAERTHTCGAGRPLLLHSDQPTSESTLERDIIAKTEPKTVHLPRGAQSMDESQWAQAAAKRISGCIYIYIY